MDIIGPFTKTKRGNQFILSIQRNLYFSEKSTSTIIENLQHYIFKEIQLESSTACR